MVWIGLVRPMVGDLLFSPCGPVWSKLSASEITLPFLTRPAAAMMSAALVKLSVPISSSGPHLPQFLYFSAASLRSSRVTLRPAIGLPAFVCWWVDGLPVAHARPNEGSMIASRLDIGGRLGRKMLCARLGCGLGFTHFSQSWSSRHCLRDRAKQRTPIRLGRSASSCCSLPAGLPT